MNDCWPCFVFWKFLHKPMKTICMLGEMYKEAISLFARLLKSFSFSGRIYTNQRLPQLAWDWKAMLLLYIYKPSQHWNSYPSKKHWILLTVRRKQFNQRNKNSNSSNDTILRPWSQIRWSMSILDPCPEGRKSHQWSTWRLSAPLEEVWHWTSSPGLGLIRLKTMRGNNKKDQNKSKNLQWNLERKKMRDEVYVARDDP